MANANFVWCLHVYISFLLYDFRHAICLPLLHLYLCLFCAILGAQQNNPESLDSWKEDETIPCMVLEL